MDNVDLLIVGGGPSAFAFVAGLARGTIGRTWLVVPSPATKQSTEWFRSLRKTPKLRQTEVDANRIDWLRSLPQSVSGANKFSYIGLHGVGGAAQHWGAGIGLFDPSDLDRNGFDVKTFSEGYAEWGNRIPISGNLLDELYRDYSILPITPSVARSPRIARLDGRYSNGQLRIGAARNAVHHEGRFACYACNRCLTGCPIKSIWVPSLRDFLDLSSCLQRIDGRVVSLRPAHRPGWLVELRRPGPDRLTSEYVYARKVVLACGPMQTFQLLAPLAGPQARASLKHTPAIAFAFIAPRQKRYEIFGMANATFIWRNQSGASALFGHLFDGTSLQGFQSRVFSSNIFVDKIASNVAGHFIFGNGFLPSHFGEIGLSAEEDSVQFDFNSSASRSEVRSAVAEIKRALRSFAHEANLPLVAFQLSEPGLDVHYAGGVPKLFCGKKLPEGRLEGIDDILVVGGAAFSHLAPQSPTFSFMVQAWMAGRSL
jgi:hypothetical protein